MHLQVLAASIVLSLLSPVLASNWPMLRSDAARTGYTDEPLPTDLRWSGGTNRLTDPSSLGLGPNDNDSTNAISRSFLPGSCFSVALWIANCTAWMRPMVNRIGPTSLVVQSGLHQWPGETELR